MLMYPRKGLITDPYNPEECLIQDDQYLEALHNDPQFQPQDFLQQSCLQPSVSLQANQQFEPASLTQFASPPSSAPSSPTFSSPTFSIPYPPTTAADSQSLGAPSMTPASSYNPSFDTQGSASPASQQYLSQYQPYYAPMLAHQQPMATGQSWDSNLQLLTPARVPYSHKTSPLPSSNRSAPSGPASSNGHRRSDSSAKPLPTPAQTPVQAQFMTAPYQNYENPSWDATTAESESAMRKAIMEQQQQNQHTSPTQQQQQGDYSLAPSVSTVSHNSPVTPQTNLDELEDTKTMTNDYAGNNAGMVSIPKLNRTMSDIFQDELFNPTIITNSQPAVKPANSHMVNSRSMMADRLQAANQGHLSARSGSPVLGIKRERSPFRHTSPFAGDLQMATSVPMPQNLMSMAPAAHQTELKTMSPKDAVLDLDEGSDPSMPPLFPPQSADFNLGDALGLRRENSGHMRSALSTLDVFPGQYATVQNPQYNFPQPRSQASLLQQTPEFPTSLPRLESTGSDLQSGSLTPQAKLPVNESITRPNHTTSDSGTYTCTYHGCTLRFETPAKLQRHKREAHRQTTPGGHLIARDASLRNSQAGPHKCERINPSTGKPCNSIFSRPYDLTRHEDTIHNARKQKVRCHLCTEEKTFSRNDALTRHMRVVHPEVDWPGKQRRRGRD
ncbi:Transcriptional regulator RPN4-like protein [Penicillium ucsense]|uniref:Transcriptional regulator RPN4-like protein n=1 Tax=Penicillium ucsense TaxID=2839758 RepID=A0A8J8WK80_9EURO|nr:Transcriptional regulator RPN4-like protein [Penicillium ucsense]KAF7734506.1 Transcriptional regulator RPN4-like protein [Penicillium ucsense]